MAKMTSKDLLVTYACTNLVNSDAKADRAAVIATGALDGLHFTIAGQGTTEGVYKCLVQKTMTVDGVSQLVTSIAAKCYMWDDKLRDMKDIAKLIKQTFNWVDGAILITELGCNQLSFVNDVEKLRLKILKGSVSQKPTPVKRGKRAVDADADAENSDDLTRTGAESDDVSEDAEEEAESDEHASGLLDFEDEEVLHLKGDAKRVVDRMFTASKRITSEDVLMQRMLMAVDSSLSVCNALILDLQDTKVELKDAASILIQRPS